LNLTCISFVITRLNRHISLLVAIVGAIVDPTQNVTSSQLTWANTAKQKVVKPKL
jgi:hypothetical protein